MTTLSAERVGRITGSRVAGILGLSPYMSRDEVLRDMVRDAFWEKPDFEGNFITDYGREHEPDAIRDYEFARGVIVRKAGAEQELVVHPEFDDLAVTPDGLVEHDGMVEAKAPWRAPYTHIDQRRDYQAQINLQLEVLKREWCDFAVWRPDADIAISRVEYDPEWLPSVRPKLDEFMAEYRRVIADPELYQPHLEPLVDIRTDAEWRDAAIEALDLKAAAERTAAEFEEAKLRLTDLAADKTTRGAGVLLVRTKAKAGSISYAKAVKALLPDADLTPFTGKPGQPGWTLRRTLEKEN